MTAETQALLAQAIMALDKVVKLADATPADKLPPYPWDGDLRMVRAWVSRLYVQAGRVATPDAASTSST
jgi:hypothetical protein